MPTISALPAELLLTIFEHPSLDIIDLLRISVTCRNLHNLINTHARMQEQLWNRPQSADKQARTPLPNPCYIDVNVLIRRVPATIWNDYLESAWEITFELVRDQTVPSHLSNLITTNFERYLHLVNPRFVRQPPYAGCELRMPGHQKRSIVFQGVDDLKQKTRLHTHHEKESWNHMLVSQHLVTGLDVELHLVTRVGARHSYARREAIAVRKGLKRQPKDEMKMKHLVRCLQVGLAGVWRAIESLMDKLEPQDICSPRNIAAILERFGRLAPGPVPGSALY